MAQSRSLLVKAGIAGLLATAGVVPAAGAVLAYPGVPAAAVIVAANCAAVPAGGSCSITAKFVSAEGQAIVGASVTWTISVPPGGTISPNPSTTDADGNTTVTYQAPAAGTAAAPSGLFLASVVKLAETTTCPPGTITGTAGGVSVTTQVTVACTTAGGGFILPNTSSGSGPGAGVNRSELLVALFGALVAVGGIARWKRSRRLSMLSRQQ